MSTRSFPLLITVLAVVDAGRSLTLGRMCCVGRVLPLLLDAQLQHPQLRHPVRGLPERLRSLQEGRDLPQEVGVRSLNLSSA